MVDDIDQHEFFTIAFMLFCIQNEASRPLHTDLLATIYNKTYQWLRAVEQCYKEFPVSSKF